MEKEMIASPEKGELETSGKDLESPSALQPSSEKAANQPSYPDGTEQQQQQLQFDQEQQQHHSRPSSSSIGSREKVLTILGVDGQYRDPSASQDVLAMSRSGAASEEANNSLTPSQHYQPATNPLSPSGSRHSLPSLKSSKEGRPKSVAFDTKDSAVVAIPPPPPLTGPRSSVSEASFSDLAGGGADSSQKKEEGGRREVINDYQSKAMFQHTILLIICVIGSLGGAAMLSVYASAPTAKGRTEKYFMFTQRLRGASLPDAAIGVEAGFSGTPVYRLCSGFVPFECKGATEDPATCSPSTSIIINSSGSSNISSISTLSHQEDCPCGVDLLWEQCPLSPLTLAEAGCKQVEDRISTAVRLALAVVIIQIVLVIAGLFSCFGKDNSPWMRFFILPVAHLAVYLPLACVVLYQFSQMLTTQCDSLQGLSTTPKSLNDMGFVGHERLLVIDAGAIIVIVFSALCFIQTVVFHYRGN